MKIVRIKLERKKVTIDNLIKKLESHEKRMSEEMNIEKAVIMLQAVVILSKDKEIHSLVGEVIRFLRKKNANDR